MGARPASGPGPSPRRLALWAAALVLPLLLSALFLPRLVRTLRGGVPAGLAALPGGRTEGEPAPRPPSAPTAAQIEAAREAELELAKAQRGWEKSKTFAPREPERDAEGALFSPFQGFGVSIDTRPDGARVLVNGKHLGDTPLLASVSCTPGEPVELALERRGFQPHRQSLRCRADSLLTLIVELRR